MSVNDDCLFCLISQGSIPAEVLLESPGAMALRDVDPKAPTHFLVIPKSHFTDIEDLAANDLNLIGELLALGAEVAKNQGLTQGYRIVTNTGRDAGQSVSHLHFHVLGGRSLSWPPG